MQYKILIILALNSFFPIQAEELERSTITSCAYQAGTAREIQTIRQTEGDDLTVFEQKVMEIYGDSQGRNDLIAIAKRVYLQPSKLSVDAVYSEIFNACVQRIHGNEPAA